MAHFTKVEKSLSIGAISKRKRILHSYSGHTELFMRKKTSFFEHGNKDQQVFSLIVKNMKWEKQSHRSSGFAFL